MHLTYPCSLGFVPESRIPRRFYLSSGRHSLESSPKGCPFFQEPSKDSSFLSAQHCDRVAFTSESYSWCSNSLHSTEVVTFSGGRRDECLTLWELLEEAKDLWDQREHGWAWPWPEGWVFQGLLDVVFKYFTLNSTKHRNDLLSNVNITVLLSHIEPLGYNVMFTHSHMFTEIFHFCT